MRTRFAASLVVLAMLGFVAASGSTEATAPAIEGTSKRSAAAAASVQATESKKLEHVDDLAERRIGVLQGSAHVEYVEKTWPRATLLQYNTPADLLLAVKAGKVDAALSDAEPLREMLRRDKTLGVLGESLSSFPEGVGFRKDNNVLLEQFNRFLAELKQSGIHADMVDRWMERNVTDMPAIPNAGSSGVLVVGVSDGSLPFMAVKDNKLIGFEIELAERFGAHLGRKVRFSHIDFSGLIAAVATGKVDMIVAALFITDERRQSIDFSDPYYEEATRVFGLKKNIAAYDTAGDGSALPFITELRESFHRNIIHEKRYLLLWDGLAATVVISIFATLLGTLLGALVCYMRMSKRGVLNVFARVYIDIMRGVPVLVLLMIVFYIAFASVSIDPIVVAIIAFALNFAAYAAEIFRSGVEGIDKGQTEAGIAMGFGRVSTFVYIVLPQTVQRILPVYRGEFISLVKMTSIVGYIAVQDLTKAGDIIRSRTFDAFFPLILVAVLYLAIVSVLMLALEYVERATDPQRRRAHAARA
jgi:polar amino acid transport system substrate-binding protein